jgi:tetratricopeptide (TPR) repeat protein
MTLILFIWAFDFSKHGSVFIKRYLTYIPYMITGVVYMILRTYALKGFAQKEMVRTGFYESAVNVPPTIMRYFLKLLWPSNLSVIYTYEPFNSLFDIFVILSLVLIIAVCALMYIFRKRRILGFSVFWIIIPLLPVLYIPVVSIGGFADRYLYLPSAGFGMLLALLLMAAGASNAGRQKAVVIFSLVVLIVYGALSVNRFSVWKDEHSLWSDALKNSPENSKVHVSLGNVYRNKGDIEKSVQHYLEAIRLNPLEFNSNFNLAMTYMDLGDISKAREYFLEAIRIKPFDDRPHYNIALTYHKTGRIEKAVEHLNEAVRINPINDNAHYNLAWIYNETGKTGKAKRHYQEVVSLSPQSVDAYYNLALIYMKEGDLREAFSALDEVLKIDPGYKDARNLQDELREKLPGGGS